MMMANELEKNTVRFIDANKECLEFLARHYFDPAVACHDQNSSCPRIEDTLRFIERNFEREEFLIRASGYKAFDEHKKDHEVLTKALKRIQKKFKCNEYDNAIVIDEIKKWISRHTAEFDHDFIQYWAENNGLSKLSE
jgi:hemerythrin